MNTIPKFNLYLAHVSMVAVHFSYNNGDACSIPIVQIVSSEKRSERWRW